MASRFGPLLLAWTRKSFGCSSNTAMTAGSPTDSPAPMNWVARALLPEPAGPVTRIESPDGTPPPSISSRSATPVDNRFLGCFRSGSLLRRMAREDIETVAGDAHSVEPGQRRLAAHFRDLQ